jgi:hypothetical protein
MLDDRHADLVRPWDDPADPRPPVHAPDGSWPNPEFIEWAKRSGHRRWVYMGFDKAEERTDER